MQDIVWNWWCVDEARSGSMRVSASRIVHFTPLYNQKQTIICRIWHIVPKCYCSLRPREKPNRLRVVHKCEVLRPPHTWVPALQVLTVHSQLFQSDHGSRAHLSYVPVKPDQPVGESPPIWGRVQYLVQRGYSMPTTRSRGRAETSGMRYRG